MKLWSVVLSFSRVGYLALREMYPVIPNQSASYAICLSFFPFKGTAKWGKTLLLQSYTIPWGHILSLPVYLAIYLSIYLSVCLWPRQAVDTMWQKQYGFELGHILEFIKTERSPRTKSLKIFHDMYVGTALNNEINCNWRHHFFPDYVFCMNIASEHWWCVISSC